MIPCRSSSTGGQFKRQQSSFRDSVSAEGKFQPEKGRYFLVVSLACPWAHRTLLVRSLKGLQDVIPVFTVHPHMGTQGWSFDGEYTPRPMAARLWQGQYS